MITDDDVTPRDPRSPMQEILDEVIKTRQSSEETARIATELHEEVDRRLNRLEILVPASVLISLLAIIIEIIHH